MLPSERDELIVNYFAEGLSLLQRKGNDYAGQEDCLANLREFGLPGIIIRLFDKVYRLKGIVKGGQIAIKDESIADTLTDIANYCYLGRIFAEGKDVAEKQAVINDCQCIMANVESVSGIGDNEGETMGRNRRFIKKENHASFK